MSKDLDSFDDDFPEEDEVFSEEDFFEDNFQDKRKSTKQRLEEHFELKKLKFELDDYL